MNISERKALDKFYTKPHIAAIVSRDFKSVLLSNCDDVTVIAISLHLY